MYFAEEIAEECGHGHISRSEALRRLRVLGLSAAVALSLLATACGSDDNGPTQNVASNEPTNGAPATAGNNTLGGTNVADVYDTATVKWRTLAVIEEVVSGGDIYP